MGNGPYSEGVLSGELGGGFSAEANLDNCVAAKIVASTSITLSGSIYAKVGSKKVTYKPKGEFGGVEIKVSFLVDYSGGWEYTKAWQPVQPFVFYEPGEVVIMTWREE